MKTIRVVPNGSAMTASAVFATGNRDDENQPFFETMSARDAFRHAGMSEDDTRALIADLPPCPASTAWTDAMMQVLALTSADQWRPYDEAVADTDTEREALLALDALGDSLRETSPLLDVVADMVDRCPLSAFSQCDLGDLRDWVAAVTGEAFQTGMPCDGYCDKHGDFCYHESRARSVSWEHIRAIAPGTRSTIADLVGALTAEMPALGENDNGAARKIARSD